MPPADRRLSVMQAMIGGGPGDVSGTPPININITLPDLAAALERFSTPDGQALKVRDGVSPRP